MCQTVPVAASHPQALFFFLGAGDVHQVKNRDTYRELWSLFETCLKHASDVLEMCCGEQAHTPRGFGRCLQASAAVRDFESKDDIRVFLLPHKVGAAGLTLNRG